MELGFSLGFSFVLSCLDVAESQVNHLILFVDMSLAKIHEPLSRV